MTYSVSPEQCLAFASAYLLEKMVNTPTTFPVLLDRDNAHLEEILTFMMVRDYVDIQDQARYVPTPKGREVVRRFQNRYQDFLRNFDIYCAVDLGMGEFAFACYWDFEDEAEWRDHLDDDRWEDLRVAVAEFKNLDPVEMVFMSFLHEGRFGFTQDGWQFDLLLGSVWDDIVKICNTALKVEDLAYEDDSGGFISGEDVITDVITQGAEMNMDLWKVESRRAQALGDEAFERRFGGADQPEVVEKVGVEEIPEAVYVGYARDPLYVNPVWLAVLFL